MHFRSGSVPSRVRPSVCASGRAGPGHPDAKQNILITTMLYNEASRTVFKICLNIGSTGRSQAVAYISLTEANSNVVFYTWLF